MEILKPLNKTKEWLLELFFPRRCLGCDKEGQYICKDCEIFLSESLNIADPNLTEAKPRSNNAMSVWDYEGLIEKAILKIKYDGCYDIINELVEKAFEKIDLNLPADTYITYVPMYKKKELQRGFNQSELIAKKIGEIIDRPIVGLLEKIKDNRSQVGLNPKERIDNVKDVFSWSRWSLGQPKPENVLLVDDFLITGATMRECIKVLKEGDMRNIWGFTLAKVV